MGITDESNHGNAEIAFHSWCFKVHPKSTPKGDVMSLVDALAGIDTLNLIALGAVVFIGLPHGAMDGALAAHFGWMESKQKAALFLLGYVAMAVLVVGFWFIAPAISFIIFLAISMYHFGKGDVSGTDNRFTAIESLARGGPVSYTHLTLPKTLQV